MVSGKESVSAAHDSATADSDQSLPVLRLGSRNAQRKLYLLPCFLAVLAGLLTFLLDWRAAMLVLALSGAWVLWRCPWSRERQGFLPRLLLQQSDGQVTVRLQNGERRSGRVLAGGVYAYRFLLLPVQADDGHLLVVMASFRPGERNWRHWRLHARRHWSVAATSRSAGADAAPAPAAAGNPDRDGNRVTRAVVRPPG